MGQGARGERLYVLGAEKCGGLESRILTTRGEKALQRRNLCVQFLRAAQRLSLPVLTMALRGPPLMGARLLRFLSLSSGFRLYLTLLLPLHFSPDADNAGRTTTHEVLALPEALWLSPQPGVTTRLYSAIAVSHIHAPTATSPPHLPRSTELEGGRGRARHRCGWATKGGQETVLAVDITRGGFEWALRNACLSSHVRGVHADLAGWRRELRRAPARVQWDPERDLRLRPLSYRSLQLGLSGEAVRRYADEWTVGIRDVTPLGREIHALVSDGDLDSAARSLPQERPCPAGDDLLAHLRG